ncbi:hypothetical protein PUMCH_000915 [Australozyma saopauloensis]|uniref:Protein-tyrosine-phosphatase n=1 Tax=Australozyma saopauloensis TaxID=291208 RepID=A0AAX4H5E5_9ASCO|nr:hypothetical protein PUMCH_000915 [[Candida] saopauloensis]
MNAPIPKTTVPAYERSESDLRFMADQQRRKTNTFWGKAGQFLRALLGRPNEFEDFVVGSERNDCAFVAKYSQVTTIKTSRIRDMSVQSVTLHTMHAPHPLINFAKEEPLSDEIVAQIRELPVLVFIHGLGGQMSQFEPLMGLLSQCLEIYSMDLPGFGDSRMEFKNGHDRLTKEEQAKISTSILAMAWLDFETDNIVLLIAAFIEQNVPLEKNFVLVGHSMGTHLLIKLANRLKRHRVEGLVLLSPPRLNNSLTNTENRPGLSLFKTLNLMRWIFNFPFLFNLFRTWDRLEGLYSRSVSRQLPADSSLHMKLRQFRWNLDIDTRVLLRYIRGFKHAKTTELLDALTKFNDNVIDSHTYEKILLIGGLEDQVTPISIVEEIHDFLINSTKRQVVNMMQVKNAGHSLLLAKPEFISGMILNHMELKLPKRLHLCPAWVLGLKAHISGDKWGLKNELKWKKTQAVSYNITRRGGTDIAPLLGLKTLREEDPEHSPQIIEKKFYGGSEAMVDGHLVKGSLIAIVDISADIPPYLAKSFEHIQYYKCATVSKVVPDGCAIRRFIQLIDDILSSTEEKKPLVAVHCHYGFNRTGFLICCYLVERLGWTVAEAVDGFKAAKAPGIKHQHFIDALFVRYE